MQNVLKKISPRELRMLLAGLVAVVVAAVSVSLLVPQVKRLLAARRFTCGTKRETETAATTTATSPASSMRSSRGEIFLSTFCITDPSMRC
jgi:type II secretory pathway component PulM